MRDITGPQGVGGATWHTGLGAPANSLGDNDDLYFRTSNSNVYRKSAGVWSVVADLSGADGATWHTGAGAPASSLGDNGDWYFRTSNANIYRKSGGSWSVQVDIDGEDGIDGVDGTPGAEWHSGSGVPSSSLGIRGDWYFRTSNGFVYEKTGSSTWTFRRDITGPRGLQGDPAALGFGSVQTANIALSATADLKSSVTNSGFAVTSSNWTTILSHSIPGGSGFRVAITGLVSFRSTTTQEIQRLEQRIRVGSITVATGGTSIGQIDYDLVGTNLDRAHPSTAIVSLQYRRTSGTNGRIGFSMLTVVLAKR